MATKKMAIYHRKEISGGSFVNGKVIRRYKETDESVRVMAIAEGYAMVRKPRATPFVVRMAEITFLEAARGN